MSTNIDDLTLNDIAKKYYEHVTLYANECLDDSYWSEDTNCRNTSARHYPLSILVHNRISQTANNSEWVIYNYKARLVAVISSHRDAYEEKSSPVNFDTARAYYALWNDILDEVRLLKQEAE